MGGQEALLHHVFDVFSGYAEAAGGAPGEVKVAFVQPLPGNCVTRPAPLHQSDVGQVVAWLSFCLC